MVEHAEREPEKVQQGDAAPVGEHASVEANTVKAALTQDQCQIVADLGYDKMNPVERGLCLMENFQTTNNMVAKLQSGQGAEVSTADLAKQVKVNDALGAFQLQENTRNMAALASAETMLKQPTTRQA
jgi:hypothetical protein